MALCRAAACGCEAGGADGCPVYCEMCERFAPICPVCDAVYGEHRLDCTVPDGYDDCGEGPFDSEHDAEGFASAEVGVEWFVAQRGGKWYVMVHDGEDH